MEITLPQTTDEHGVYSSRGWRATMAHTLTASLGMRSPRESKMARRRERLIRRLPMELGGRVVQRALSRAQALCRRAERLKARVDSIVASITQGVPPPSDFLARMEEATRVANACTLASQAASRIANTSAWRLTIILTPAVSAVRKRPWLRLATVRRSRARRPRARRAHRVVARMAGTSASTGDPDPEPELPTTRRYLGCEVAP